MSFFINRFWANKKFQKISKNFGFQKVENFKKVRNFSKVENFSISKKNIFRKIMFSETLRYILSEKNNFRKIQVNDQVAFSSNRSEIINYRFYNITKLHKNWENLQFRREV